MGCFLIKDSSDPIPFLENLDPTLVINASSDWTVLAPALCAQASRASGFSAFGLRDRGMWCASSADAETTYNKYGLSGACDGRGLGGPNALDVYWLTGEQSGRTGDWLAALPNVSHTC